MPFKSFINLRKTNSALTPLFAAVIAGFGGGIVFGFAKLHETLRVRNSVVVQDMRPFGGMVQRGESENMTETLWSRLNSA